MKEHISLDTVIVRVLSVILSQERGPSSKKKVNPEVTHLRKLTGVEIHGPKLGFGLTF